ncbi:pyrroline-5-carboxylate reductase [Coniochaeta ligniaria NRRL 30616]|uniref:Pyrroline-5-carboxylate reductase n=1 Tax=Coniochaeta ligniaria NRRL 30616 TaxID=1408157 RepID=A0A1J7J0B6_9PEZI|nr:pyrroline-5-carboxylate reductase [Coniochaeta ligniaria NRRL 30616]
MASNGASSEELTMAVLGCGTMGISILSGILTSLQELSESGTSTPFSNEETPSRLPSRFIACVRRPESAEKVASALGHFPALKIVQNENVPSAQQSEVVLLACKPSALSEVLNEEGMREALKGKLLISILPGVSVQQIEDTLYPRLTYADQLAGVKQLDVECTVVRAMPNTASLVRASMTVVNTRTNPPLDAQTSALVGWIFRRIGDVVYLPPATMDAATALCGSGPAFFALMLEAAVDGAVAMGLPRAEAQRMAAQTMRGTAELVLNGEHPALLKDKVCTPGGCTIGGLLVLEEGRVRGTVARAVREATVVAGQLGKGVQGVNGTRFGNGQFA